MRNRSLRHLQPWKNHRNPKKKEKRKIRSKTNKTTQMHRIKKMKHRLVAQRKIVISARIGDVVSLRAKKTR